MTDLNQLVSRDNVIALRETNAGMHHAGFWEAVICRLLNTVGTTYGHLSADYCNTGSHTGCFIDPITGIEYEIKITPRNLKIRRAA